LWTTDPSIFAAAIFVSLRAKPLNSSLVRDLHSNQWNFKNEEMTPR
jgi:hypothetical protein